MNDIKKFRFDRPVPSHFVVAVDLNWAAIAAAILVIGVGTSFWIVVGLMIAQLWK